MNAFDTSIQTYLIHIAPSSDVFTHAVRVLADFYVFKGVLPLAILYAMWFKPGSSLAYRREMVVAILSSAMVAFVVGRLLALLLPFRLRPIYDASLGLAFPGASDASNHLRLWSSLPSDHAALWMSVAVGILLVWRWIGVLAVLHCALFICLPRVYLGLHYPTDVIAGAVIGATVVVLLTRDGLRARFAPCIVGLMDRSPAVGYTAAFLFFFELATMFDEPRLLAISLFKVL
ncbi:Phosphoesterase PA-phosphatase related protein [Burkholderia sp. 8Y]|uniref:phosphatase PAP2 family protein n=1 Tax=Burkholderia sp. 8Y TaxID=2653133 RepID=UPI0012F0911B|nr:phosphatase PAP2 family protein [Burkholderia sp. 8Y]VXC17682.1 Phosphoesterase PA-phosphatase related protein [Burkholderia sp. 8Y]